MSVCHMFLGLQGRHDLLHEILMGNEFQCKNWIRRLALTGILKCCKTSKCTWKCWHEQMKVSSPLPSSHFNPWNDPKTGAQTPYVKFRATRNWWSNPHVVVVDDKDSIQWRSEELKVLNNQRIRMVGRSKLELRDWLKLQEAKHWSNALMDKVWHITLPSLFVTAVTSSLTGIFLLLLFGGDFIGGFRNLSFGLLLFYAILFWLLVSFPIKPIQQVDLKSLAQKHMKDTFLS